jgi:hypothetical protein
MKCSEGLRYITGVSHLKKAEHAKTTTSARKDMANILGALKASY